MNVVLTGRNAATRDWRPRRARTGTDRRRPTGCDHVHVGRPVAMDSHHGVADRSQRAGESGGGSGAVENWVSSATVPTAAVPVNNFGWECVA
jgi:hypothetical protein